MDNKKTTTSKTAAVDAEKHKGNRNDGLRRASDRKSAHSETTVITSTKNTKISKKLKTSTITIATQQQNDANGSSSNSNSILCQEQRRVDDRKNVHSEKTIAAKNTKTPKITKARDTHDASALNRAVISEEQRKEFLFWIRINLAIEIFIKKGLLSFLHNKTEDPSYTGLTEDPVKLHAHMVEFKKEKRQQLSRVIKADQWDILCPSPATSNTEDPESCSDDWDITLICVIVINTEGLPAPKNGWNQKTGNSLLISLLKTNLNL